MSDKSKQLRDQKAIAARIKADQDNPPPRFVVRCAVCRRAQDEVAVLIEMGSFLACDQCIELAYRAVKLRKGGRSRQ